jgi:AraC family transcriptional regulator
MHSSASPHGQAPLRLSSNSDVVARRARAWPGLRDGDLRHVAGGPTEATPSRGGLSGWQRKTVSDYIESNLAQALRLADMARLARLSPFHFARAFKQSFGMPPHRYHVTRRIARAKDLLAESGNSVTDIARELGFAQTSSFSSTFRRVAGASPSDFRRNGA